MANFFSMYFARMNSLLSSLWQQKKKTDLVLAQISMTTRKREEISGLHGAIHVRLGDVQRGLHDLVEAMVRHVPGDEELRRGNVIQLSKRKKTGQIFRIRSLIIKTFSEWRMFYHEGLDAGDVDAHLPVNARAFDANDDAEIRR